MRIAAVFAVLCSLFTFSQASEFVHRTVSSVRHGNAFQFEGGERVRIDLENQAMPLEQVVTSDGYVSLPTGGAVNISGLNLQQVSELLAAHIERSSGIRKPKVSIAVLQPKIHKAYIQGEVTRPQAIELPADGSLALAAALAIAEGPTADADITRVKVVHQSEHAPKIEIVDASQFEVAEQESLGPVLRSGDVIIVPRAGTISVTGEIAQPGVFSRKHIRNAPSQPMRLSQAIAAAGGAKPSANLRAVILVRTQNNERRSTTYNLETALEQQNIGQDPALVDGDQVVVPASAGFTILGKVKSPGSYYGKPMTVSRLIAMAGGLDQFAKKSGIIVSRKEGSFRVDFGEITKEGRIEQDPLLNPGDIVYVGERML
jgi:protein involved in polysaccharide export with SLBB domain